MSKPVNPCIDCICLPTCRLLIKDYTCIELFEQIHVMAQLIYKCPECKSIIQKNEIPIAEEIILRNIYYETK